MKHWKWISLGIGALVCAWLLAGGHGAPRGTKHREAALSGVQPLPKTTEVTVTPSSHSGTLRRAEKSNRLIDTPLWTKRSARPRTLHSNCITGWFQLHIRPTDRGRESYAT
jgi:hypothetical protein